MTVAELIASLHRLDPNLPVLVDGYEWGLQLAHEPRQIIAERKEDVATCGGDWEEPGGIGWGSVLEAARPVVLISRNAQ